MYFSQRIKEDRRVNHACVEGSAVCSYICSIYLNKMNNNVTICELLHTEPQFRSTQCLLLLLHLSSWSQLFYPLSLWSRQFITGSETLVWDQDTSILCLIKLIKLRSLNGHWSAAVIRLSLWQESALFVSRIVIRVQKENISELFSYCWICKALLKLRSSNFS